MKQIQIWKFLTLFLAGVIISMVFLMLSYQESPEPSVSEAPSQPVVIDAFGGLKTIADLRSSDPDKGQDEANSEKDGQNLLRGDRYLVGGNYVLALDNYLALNNSPKQGDASILLRKAMCYERQAKMKSAEKLYLKAIQTASQANHQIIGIIGFSRILANGNRIDEAINLLSEQILIVDRAEAIPHDVRALLVFQYAKTLEKKALIADRGNLTDNQAQQDLTAPGILATDESLPVPELVLGMIDNTIQDAPPDRLELLPPGFSIQQRPADSASTISASVSFHISPVNTILRNIAATSGLQVELSPKASARIKGRSRAVEIRTTTLASLFDQLLVSFDLFWHQDGAIIKVVTSEEANVHSHNPDFLFESANRALRRFDVDFPESIWRQLALLSRSSLTLTQGRFDEAGNLFKELEQTNPVNGVLARLFFNQAKLSLLLNRKKEAKNFLYLAIDQTVNPDIEASSYCLLSGLHLSDGEIEETIKTARRGLATAVTNQQRQIAILNSSRAYLLKNDPFSANTTIFDHHQFVTDPSNRKIAAMLGAYARFSGVANSRSMEVARTRLLRALTSMSNDDYSTFPDCYLGGKAYESLGFQDYAIKMLTLAIARADAGVWQRKAIFELGMLQKRAGQFPESQTTFSMLRDVQDIWRTKALHQIAIVYQKENQTELCIETCRELWRAELDEPLKISALQVLGNAFQAKGEHHSAALCFAGMIPDDF